MLSLADNNGAKTTKTTKNTKNTKNTKTKTKTTKTTKTKTTKTTKTKTKTKTTKTFGSSDMNSAHHSRDLRISLKYNASSQGAIKPTPLLG